MPQYVIAGDLSSRHLQTNQHTIMAPSGLDGAETNDCKMLRNSAGDLEARGFSVSPEL